MHELKKQAESILFSVGKKIDIEEIAKLVRVSNINEVKKALKELKNDYEKRDTSLMVVDDGTKWKIIVKESYVPLVKKIVADTELSRTVMETLAVIAWKQPILQSEVIKIRTNKAYDHINELEEMGFLTRQKQGRTQRIKLTQKFFNYFELNGDKDIKEFFKGIKEESESQKKINEEYKEGKENAVDVKVPEVQKQDALPEQKQGPKQ